MPLVTLTAALLSGAGLGGCGQKGPLRLPDPPATASGAAAPAATAPRPTPAASAPRP